ncbi:MAG: transposase [Flavobacteriales bacterium Tduv]
MFRLFGVENKKFGSILKSSEQIRFNELCMELSTRRSEFFKRLKTLIHWEGMEKEIRKIYQKGQGIKSQSAYSGISLFKMMLLSHGYDLNDVGTEELVKKSLNCICFCSFRLENQIPEHTISMQIS